MHTRFLTACEIIWEHKNIEILADWGLLHTPVDSLHSRTLAGGEWQQKWAPSNNYNPLSALWGLSFGQGFATEGP